MFRPCCSPAGKRNRDFFIFHQCTLHRQCGDDVITKCAKKTQVDLENRVFKDDWAEKYAFILPQSSTKPTCLICTETVGVMKSGNVKRHYDAKHRHFKQQYPQEREVKTAKLWQLKSLCDSTNKLFREIYDTARKSY